MVIDPGDIAPNCDNNAYCYGKSHTQAAFNSGCAPHAAAIKGQLIACFT
jgi:hypothetical protein